MTDVQDKMEACAAMGATGAEHEAMKIFEGTWKAEVKMWWEPGADPQESTGIMKTSWVLGDRFLEQDYQCDSGQFAGRGHFGYNTTDKRYEGMWVDTMTTWVNFETGSYDEASKTYTMTSSMTCPMRGATVNKRSVVRVLSDDEHVMEMYFSDPGSSEENKGMEIRYTRA